MKLRVERHNFSQVTECVREKEREQTVGGGGSSRRSDRAFFDPLSFS